jgi:hypothetical protein
MKIYNYYLHKYIAQLVDPKKTLELACRITVQPVRGLALESPKETVQ